MRYFVLSPEVAAMGLGEHTVMDRSTHPPKVSHLHFDFDVWLGDDLIEAFPCFVVTTQLADEMRKHTFSGYELKAVEISTSDMFRDFQNLHPDRELPEFVWLDITGTAGTDDFGVNKEGRLVVSEDAFAVLKAAHLDNCEVSEFVKA